VSLWGTVSFIHRPIAPPCTRAHEKAERETEDERPRTTLCDQRHVSARHVEYQPDLVSLVVTVRCERAVSRELPLPIEHQPDESMAAFDRSKGYRSRELASKDRQREPRRIEVAIVAWFRDREHSMLCSDCLLIASLVLLASRTPPARSLVSQSSADASSSR
jgi:hypothetical protein